MDPRWRKAPQKQRSAASALPTLDRFQA
ncbi:hypothetical protein LUU34_00955700 [Aix galericulata]|nr:hypothetical protein LUU34_00955700 [Aix galericulata]